MARTSASWCQVMIYCTFCGSRPVRRLDTGEERVVVFSVRRSELDQTRDDLARSACLYCKEPLELRVVGE